MANGSYPGDPSTYYWISDNNFDGTRCSAGGLKPYLPDVCTFLDPQGKPYSYAKNLDGTYKLGAPFETVTKQATVFTYGYGTQRSGYWDSGVDILNPAAYCLSPSSNFRIIAQRWLDNGNSVCLTAGEFDLNGEALVIDGSSVSRNNISIGGAGADQTRIRWNGYGPAISLRGTLRNLDIGSLAIIGSMNGYYIDGTLPRQLSTQTAVQAETGQSAISQARMISRFRIFATASLFKEAVQHTYSRMPGRLATVRDQPATATIPSRAIPSEISTEWRMNISLGD